MLRDIIRGVVSLPVAPVNFAFKPSFTTAGKTVGVSTFSGVIRIGRGVGRFFSSKLDEKVHNAAMKNFAGIEYRKEGDNHWVNGLKDIGRGFIEMIPIIGNITVIAYDNFRRKNNYTEV